jgi:hypothetical protein
MYKAIIPATDWYFLHPRANEKEPPVVWNLAAWGLKEDGEVIGLVGAFGPDHAAQGKAPHLVSVPKVARCVSASQPVDGRRTATGSEKVINGRTQ